MTEKAEALAAAFGYLSPAEVAEMKRVAVEAGIRFGPKTVFVNIGAGAGTSALAMREACPRATITTVDISPTGPLGGLEGERNAFDQAGMDYPVQILGDSKDVGKDWNVPISLLYIDGDHTREGVRGDIEAWCKHVAPGGFILFHDYGSKHWPEVEPAVDEFFVDNQVNIEHASLTDTLYTISMAEGELY